MLGAVAAIVASLTIEGEDWGTSPAPSRTASRRSPRSNSSGVGEAPTVVGSDIGLIVVGGPTDAFGLSRANTRRSARHQGAAPLNSHDIGIREWLEDVRLIPAPGASAAAHAAAFDTRLRSQFSGSAARAVRRRLRQLGLPLITAPASFAVGGIAGPLLDGEVERARWWGRNGRAVFRSNTPDSPGRPGPSALVARCGRWSTGPMSATLRFLGASRTVTGSRFLVESDDARVLIDCGLYQGNRELRRRNWASFPVPGQEIDAVVLSHAYLDHCGWLPRLVRQGFHGPVLCSPWTAKVAPIVLRDAAHLQEEDADHAAGGGYSRHHPPLPLFDTADAEKALLTGARAIKAFGGYVAVNAEVASLDEFSAHADAGGILAWLRTAPTPPRTCYVVHGERVLVLPPAEAR